MKRSRSSEELNNSDEEQKMDLFLTITKTVCVSVKKSDTVQNVKGLLTEKEGISECDQDVVLGGEIINVGNRKLVECGSSLQVFVRNSDPIFVPRLHYLTVKTSSHSPIIVETRNCDTIQHVKSYIMSKQGFHSRTFDLFHVGKLLPEDRTLVSLKINARYSNLYMIFTSTMKNRLAISVKTPFGKIVKIDVRHSYTLRDVTTVVESVVNCSAGRLSFVRDGLILDNTKTLNFYNISEESTLEMVPRCMQISVTDLCLKTCIVDVYPDDTVLYVKDQLARKLGVPMEFLTLFCSGRTMSDDRSLASYNFTEESALQLFPKLINPGSGKTFGDNGVNWLGAENP